MKEANLIFINKTEFYNRSLNAYKDKINDYKNKISILKKKINELHLIIEKLKLHRNSFGYNTLGNAFHNNMVSTPGPYRRGRRGLTPFSKRLSRDNDNSLLNIKNFTLNKKSENLVLDEFNNNNSKNLDALNDIYRRKIESTICRITRKSKSY